MGPTQEFPGPVLSPLTSSSARAVPQEHGKKPALPALIIAHNASIAPKEEVGETKHVAPACSSPPFHPTS